VKQVKTGLDILVAEDFRHLRGLRVGLVAHPASVDATLRHAADLLQAAPGVTLAAVFGPEHGWLGQAQDLEAVEEKSDKRESGKAETGGPPGPRVISLYGQTVASLRPTAEQLAGLDVLVIDLQDIGSRYYTFQASMLYCLEAAHAIGLRVMILDRPNPLGGRAVEGPALRAGYESFVGPHNIATRHGLTLGELARFYQAERGRAAAQVEIIVCEGWRRGMYFEATGLPWVLPSPNMPTVDTAVVYPGQCLLEGTNLSEGRGTTRPFELCGAPWLDAGVLARKCNAEALPGVVFRPVGFKPKFQKHAGQECGGVQLHVTDRKVFQPVRTSLMLLAVMREMSGDHFRWRTETYEFVDNPIAIDLLFGGDRERQALEAGQHWREMAAGWVAEESAWRETAKPFLLYPD
jgi:uncharacterized protein YbbC (DUF1343 family)